MKYKIKVGIMDRRRTKSLEGKCGSCRFFTLETGKECVGYCSGRMNHKGRLNRTYKCIGYALTRGERNEDCPLVYIQPHGRLIDADALDGLLADMAKEYPKRPLDSIGGYWIDKFRNMLKAAPTIIEAEEGE